LCVPVTHISGTNLINPEVSANPMRPFCYVRVCRHSFFQQPFNSDLKQIIRVGGIGSERQAKTLQPWQLLDQILSLSRSQTSHKHFSLLLTDQTGNYSGLPTLIYRFLACWRQPES
jgi:hypothetical protein